MSAPAPVERGSGAVVAARSAEIRRVGKGGAAPVQFRDEAVGAPVIGLVKGSRGCGEVIRGATPDDISIAGAVDGDAQPAVLSTSAQERRVDESAAGCVELRE